MSDARERLAAAMHPAMGSARPAMADAIIAAMRAVIAAEVEPVVNRVAGDGERWSAALMSENAELRARVEALERYFGGEVKCERCGGAQTIGDELCPECGGVGYDLQPPAQSAATAERAAYERGVREFAAWLGIEPKDWGCNTTEQLADRFLRERLTAQSQNGRAGNGGMK